VYHFSFHHYAAFSSDIALWTTVMAITLSILDRFANFFRSCKEQ